MSLTTMLATHASNRFMSEIGKQLPFPDKVVMSTTNIIADGRDIDKVTIILHSACKYDLPTPPESIILDGASLSYFQTVMTQNGAKYTYLDDKDAFTFDLYVRQVKEKDLLESFKMAKWFYSYRLRSRILSILAKEIFDGTLNHKGLTFSYQELPPVNITDPALICEMFGLNGSDAYSIFNSDTDLYTHLTESKQVCFNISKWNKRIDYITDGLIHFIRMNKLNHNIPNDWHTRNEGLLAMRRNSSLYRRYSDDGSKGFIFDIMKDRYLFRLRYLTGYVFMDITKYTGPELKKFMDCYVKSCGGLAAIVNHHDDSIMGSQHIERSISFSIKAFYELYSDMMVKIEIQKAKLAKRKMMMNQFVGAHAHPGAGSSFPLDRLVIKTRGGHDSPLVVMHDDEDNVRPAPIIIKGGDDELDEIANVL